MEQLLDQIAADTGVPAELLERAARARATAQGVGVDALVSGWAGGEAPTPGPTAEPTPGAPAEPTPGAPAEPAKASEAAPSADSGAGKLPEALLRRSAAAKAKREGRPLDEVLVEMGLSPEGSVAEPSVAEPTVAEAAPTPAIEEPKTKEAVEQDDAEEDEPQPVFAGFPRWLAASFVIVPMFALLYAGLAPNGPACGSSGQLAIDPTNGEAQSCEGDASPFFTLGEDIYEANCVACHSADGSGGVGPAFTGGAVLQTFSACADHIEWVSFGTAGFPESTYGDTAKPVGGFGQMPGYENSLSEQQIAAVALYERVAFGNEDITLAETTCGLVDATGE
jgi:mono/diheme cytochrome c family protein